VLFSQAITVPANTAVADYIATTMKLTKGVVTRISVFFPWGCANLCGVQAIRKTWQVFPLTRSEWLAGNDRAYDFHTQIELQTEPFELIVYAYNLDDTYEHEPVVSVEMVKNVASKEWQNMLTALEGR